MIIKFSILYRSKMIILAFKEFKRKCKIRIKAMSNIEIGNIGRGISVIPIGILMQDQTIKSISAS